MLEDTKRTSPLRRERQSRRLTQLQVARLTGLSPGWISLLERAPEFMTPRTAAVVAKALGVDAGELLR